MNLNSSYNWRTQSIENISMPGFEVDHLFLYDEAFLINDFVTIINDGEIKHQYKAFVDRLLIYFNKVVKHISELKSALKKANETSNAEKSRRERVELERDNLEYFSDKMCYLLFKYSQRLVLTDEAIPNINTTSSDCTTINENDPITFDLSEENNDTDQLFQEEIPPTDQLCDSTNAEFQCEKCGELFAMKKKGRKLKKCPVCDKRYKSRRYKTKNKERSSMNSKNEFSSMRCDTCGKYYCNRSVLTRHIRSKHLIENPFQCAICDRWFPLKSQLKSHMSIHRSEKPFTCSACPMTFKYLSAKRRHERIIHENDIHFECAHCCGRFSRKQHLVSHIRTRHFPESSVRFECDICRKSFASKYYLMNHESVHTSLEPIKCSICDTYFKLSSTKMRHEWMIHKVGVRFDCAFCDKVYSVKQNLSRHLRKIHT